MTVVVDESVSYGLVEVLRQAGHEVVSVAELPTVGMADQQVFLLVQEHRAVLITRDYHFTNAIRFPAHLTRGILYIRRGNLTAAEEIALTQRFLLQYPADRFAGKLVTLYYEQRLDSITPHDAERMGVSAKQEGHCLTSHLAPTGSDLPAVA